MSVEHEVQQLHKSCDRLVDAAANLEVWATGVAEQARQAKKIGELIRNGGIVMNNVSAYQAVVDDLAQVSSSASNANAATVIAFRRARSE